MSHSENYTDTGRTTVFYDGMQYGVEKERERVVELLEAQIQRTNTSNVDELAGLFSAIALIKGEQK